MLFEGTSPVSRNHTDTPEVTQVCCISTSPGLCAPILEGKILNNHCGIPGMSPASLTNNLQERPELSMDSPHGSLHLPFGMSSTSTITKQFHCAPQKYLSMFLLQHMRTLNLSITKSSEKMKLSAKISPLLKNDEISCHLITSDMAGSC